MTDLATKLGIKPGQRVCLLGAPPDAAEILRAAAPAPVDFSETLAEDRYDLILFWPRTLAGLSDELGDLQKRIHPDGAIWVVMPKKRFAPQRGIAFTWEEMQAAGLQTDLVDNKTASITDTDYGTRFVIRRERRGKYFEGG